MNNILVLVSGMGSNLEHLILLTENGTLPNCKIHKVIADRTCKALTIAAEKGIENIRIPRGKNFAKELKTAIPNNTTLIVAAGFLSIIPADICSEWENKIINIHPSLLPKYGGKGMWGKYVHNAVLTNREKESGITIHYVSEEIDKGAIISQQAFPLNGITTSEQLEKKIKQLEKRILPQAILSVLQNINSYKLMNRNTKKAALISVYDKNGLLPFVKVLTKNNYVILSMGGTFQYLKDNGITVVNVETITGFPEMLGGRVKTLHPKIHAGILADRDNPEHLYDLEKYSINQIDMVVVNLYPFFEKSKESLPEHRMIEFIDIGGPCMLRAAAKNFKHVCVVSNPEDYLDIQTELTEHKSINISTRKKLAAKVFNLTTAYDAAIASYLSEENDPFPKYLNAFYIKEKQLRYGENPQQSAALYKDKLYTGAFGNSEQLAGKELSFNNLRDMDLAWKVICTFSDQNICCAVKHGTPCGVGLGANSLEAYINAYTCDPISIFGGIIAFSHSVEANLAEKLNEIFLEIVMATEFTDEALNILSRKKNLRVIKMTTACRDKYTYAKIDGCLLVQHTDTFFSKTLIPVTNTLPTPEQYETLVFAQKVVKFAKSNAIVVACKHKTLGISSGQVNRIAAAHHAIENALVKNTPASELVLASDAFFPFPDVVELCAEKGIKAIIQPGGSVKDKESIATANKYGISMIFTGMRHFLH